MTDNKPQLKYEKGFGWLDKRPRFRFAVFSVRKGQNWASLESSSGYQWQAEKLWNTYKSWDMPDTKYFLVDWDEKKLLDNFEPKENTQ